MKKGLQSTFTTPEQSKRLLELGVPAWTADCYYSASRDGYVCEGTLSIVSIDMCIESLPFPCMPSWSVGRLMEINDICAICDDKAWLGIEYPSTKRVKEKLGLSYIEFLIQSIEVAKDVLDWSKLEE